MRLIYGYNDIVLQNINCVFYNIDCVEGFIDCVYQNNDFLF